VIALVAYIKSLSQPATPAAAATANQPTSEAP
jgi:hypothetical protein